MTRRAITFALALLAAAKLASPIGAEPAPGDAAASGRPFEVYRIFQRSCAGCHGGHLPKPKGGFGFVLDLPRLSAEPDYVMPGEPQKSEIYRVLVTQDPDLKMPRPGSDAPPLSADEIELVRLWILEGAGLGPAASDASGSETPDPADSPTPATTLPPGGSFASLAGKAHPAVVHFPVAFLVAAAALQLMQWLRRRPMPGLGWVAWAGAAGALAGVATGWIAAGQEGYAEATVWAHRWLGMAAGASGLLGAIGLKLGERWAVWRLFGGVLVLVAGVLAVVAGHVGGTLVHGDWFSLK